jgi:dTDP-4-dehydrorhamnose reductase
LKKISTILLTGGSGRLGREILKHRDWFAPSRAEFDILTSPAPCRPDLIVHAAAMADVEECQRNPLKAFQVNVVGTRRLLDLFPGIPFVFVNSEYAFNPCNAYAWSKFAAGCLVRDDPRPTLELYPSHFERPWRHPTAFTDMWTFGDYVDVMALLFIEAVEGWDRKTSRAVHLGTGRKSGYDLAIRSRPDVRAETLAGWHGAPLTADYEGPVRDNLCAST